MSYAFFEILTGFILLVLQLLYLRGFNSS